jgi:hypothetical protein
MEFGDNGALTHHAPELAVPETRPELGTATVRHLPDLDQPVPVWPRRPQTAAEIQLVRQVNS